MREKAFRFSPDPEPHKGRTLAILKAHPEIKKLYGINPFTIIPIILLVAAQMVAVWAVVKWELPWWGVLAAAWGFGAFVNHALFTLTHDCSHHLISKKKWVNILGGILCDLPQIIPTHVSFKIYHMKHHSFQGHYDLDADIPSKWEAKLVGNFFLTKMIWQLLFPVFQMLRPPRMKAIQFLNAWTIINWVLVFAVDFAVIYFLGWMGFLYFLASFFFSVGLHPLGGRWIQEHYLTSESDQETFSYYGPLNYIMFNIGYHNEHHDFPSVPWSRLPMVKKMAPEFYDNLDYHTSWTGLWLRFIFDPKLSLHSRMLRENKGGKSKRVKTVSKSEPEMAGV